MTSSKNAVPVEDGFNQVDAMIIHCVKNRTSLDLAINQCAGYSLTQAEAAAAGKVAIRAVRSSFYNLFHDDRVPGHLEAIRFDPLYRQFATLELFEHLKAGGKKVGRAKHKALVAAHEARVAERTKWQLKYKAATSNATAAEKRAYRKKDPEPAVVSAPRKSEQDFGKTAAKSIMNKRSDLIDMLSHADADFDAAVELLKPSKDPLGSIDTKAGEIHWKGCVELWQAGTKQAAADSTDPLDVLILDRLGDEEGEMLRLGPPDRVHLKSDESDKGTHWRDGYPKDQFSTSGDVETLKITLGSEDDGIKVSGTVATVDSGVWFKNATRYAREHDRLSKFNGSEMTEYVRGFIKDYCQIREVDQNPERHNQ